MPRHQARQQRRVEHEAPPVFNSSVAAPSNDVIQRSSENPQNTSFSLESSNQIAQTTQEAQEPTFGHDFSNLKIHSNPQDQARFADNQLVLQRDPLPAVPNYQLNSSFGQPQDPASRYHLGGDLTLHLDPQLQASIQLHTRQSFNPGLISSGIAGLGRGFPPLTAANPAIPSPTTAPAAATAPTPGSTATPAAPSSSATPAAPGATPELPHPGSVGDIFSAFASYAPIQQALDRLQDQAASQATRDWSRLNTGERILVVSSGIVIAAPALGFSLADPTMRANLGSILNGTPLPVPGVPWLHLETNLQADSFMVGFHLDLGHLLAPVLPGFGAGSPNAIGDPPSAVQRTVQRDIQPGEPSPTPDIGSSIQTRLGNGSRLEGQALNQFSSHFGHDFSRVRIHDDAEADRLSKAVNARAFTTGQDIFFSQGTYNPHSSDGQKLLAHELTHTIQQSRGAVSGSSIGNGLAISDPNDAFEQEASSVADSVTRGEQVAVAGSSGSTVQRMVLQRETPNTTPAPASTSAPPNPPAPTTTPIPHTLNAGMFDVSGAQPSLNGVVSAHPSAGSQVTIESPDVVFNATATLHSDVQMDTDETIKVGPTQTLLGSSRVGIYRRGGLPDGEIIAEDKASVGQVRDAQWQPNRDGSVRADVEAPWYSRPSNITDTNRTAQVHYLDKPGFELPAAVGEGRLTETRGSESFITALSAKRDGQVVHLSSSHWEVPWALTIDASHAAQGGRVTGGSSDQAPPTLDGPIAVQAAQEWLAFSSIEAAMTASNRELLDHLLAAKSGNHDAYLNIVEALRRKNPTVSVQVTVNSTDSWVGTDDLELVAQGTQRRNLGQINDRGSRSVTFQLGDLIDPLAITASTNLEFELFNRNTFAPSTPATMSWAFPFSTASGRMTSGGGGGRYTLSGSIA